MKLKVIDLGIEGIPVIIRFKTKTNAGVNPKSLNVLKVFQL